MKLKIFISLLVASISGVNLIADGAFDKETFAVHPKFGMAYNIHSADFRSFEGAADCGLFEKGSGFGLAGALGFEKLISTKSFIGLSFGLVDRSAELTVSNVFPARDLANNSIVDVKADNILSAKLSYLEIQPDFRYVIADDFIKGPLRLVSALRFYLPISKSFEQKEEIVSPSGAVFVDNAGKRSRSREIASGDINTINNFGFGISAGVENLLKIGDRSYFTQQLLFDANLQDVASDAKWATYAVRLELGVRYSFVEKPKPVVEEPVPPPPPPVEIVVVEPPKPFFEVKPGKFVGKINTGNELLATVPMVNAVFFERNKAELSGAYKLGAVNEELFYGEDVVALHDYVLPRIAMIVKNNPKSSIVLESATSGPANEPLGMELAKKRADKVKEILVSLGVKESIISVSPRVAPRFMSNQDFPEGVDENQRVDIIVKNAPLQEYVDIQKYRELQGNLPVAIDYKNYPVGTKANLAGSIGSNIITVDEPGNYSIPSKMRIDEASGEQPYELIFNIDGEKHLQSSVIDLKSLSVEMIELNLDNFEAILRFDYNSSTLSDDNKGLLRQLAEKLPEGAIIQILGSADALGTEERNLQLSKERAGNTEQFIKSVSGSKFTIETGINNDKFNESTPQGRFLNRSIRIKVRQK